MVEITSYEHAPFSVCCGAFPDDWRQRVINELMSSRSDVVSCKGGFASEGASHLVPQITRACSIFLGPSLLKCCISSAASAVSTGSQLQFGGRQTVLVSAQPDEQFGTGNAFRRVVFSSLHAPSVCASTAWRRTVDRVRLSGGNDGIGGHYRMQYGTELNSAFFFLESS